jgi:hypothetical protein
VGKPWQLPESRRLELLDPDGRFHRPPFFGELCTEDVLLGNPAVWVQRDRVTHLVLPVSR